MAIVIPMGTNFPSSICSSSSSDIPEVQGQSPASFCLSSVTPVLQVRRKLHWWMQCQANFQPETSRTAVPLPVWLHFEIDVENFMQRSVGFFYVFKGFASSCFEFHSLPHCPVVHVTVLQTHQCQFNCSMQIGYKFGMR